MTSRLVVLRRSAVALALVVSAAVTLDGRAPTARERYDNARAREGRVRAAVERVAPSASTAEIDAVVRPARRLVLDYEGVVRRYPSSGYSDNALRQAAGLSEFLFGRFGRVADKTAARKYYDWLIREYPGSSLQREARVAVRALDRLVPAPSAPAARVAAARPAPSPAPTTAAAASSTPLTPVAPTAAAPTSAPGGATPGPQSGSVLAPTLRAIDRVVLDSTVRVTLALDREAPFSHEVLSGPPRAFVDLFGATIHDALQESSLRYDTDAVRQVRVGRRPGAVRVVLDLEDATRVSVFTLYNPYRVVIDATRRPEATTAATVVARSTTPAPPALTAQGGIDGPLPPPAAVVPVAVEVAPALQPVDERHVDLTPTERAAVSLDDLAPPVAAEGSSASAAPPDAVPAAPAMAPVVTSPPASRAPADTTRGGSPRQESATTSRPPAPAAPRPSVPAVNADGSFSLARQLGLGISRIVIDPGHGGHDPGTPSSGTSEARLVLDVALRLEKLLVAEGFDVVLTRRTDVFIPLEERTAIANRENADLFLSIHANSGRDPRARGIETYYLSFASNPEAEAVAARENATSTGGMHNLPGIVRAIALNNKLDESRDLAQKVQQSLATRLAKSNVGLRNRGVKKAPFVVLIGAQMPSILAEIGFITNKQEVALIKTAAYRQKIAESLEAAVLQYQRALKRQTAVATR